MKPHETLILPTPDVAGAKRYKQKSRRLRLLLVLPLIGWENGPRSLIQSQGAVTLNQIKINCRITFQNGQTKRTGDLSMNLNPTYRWQVFDDLKSITRPHMWDMVEVSWTRDELRANICVQVCQATFLCFETEPVGTTVDGISRQHLAWEAVKLRTKQINTKIKQLANLLLLFNLNMAAIAFFPLFGSGIINSSSTRKQNHFGINNQPLSRWRTCIVCEFSQVNMGDQNSPGDPCKCCQLYLQSGTKMFLKKWTLPWLVSR